MDGVVRTVVGYSGGNKANPSYYNLGDHTETIRVEYDPEKISYRKLLGVFWSSHDPFSGTSCAQYKSAVFYHSSEQYKIASETRSDLEESGRKVRTEILPAGKFYPAEDYHQKYSLRSSADFFREFEAIYPDSGDFTASTAVARVNGYLAGYGTSESLEKIIDKLGLSDKSKEALRRIAARSGRR